MARLRLLVTLLVAVVSFEASLAVVHAGGYTYDTAANARLEVGALVDGCLQYSHAGDPLEVAADWADEDRGAPSTPVAPRNATNTGPPEPSDINVGDLKDVKAPRVTSATGLTPHAIKIEYLGREAPIALFDLKRDTCTGYLIIVEKATQRIVEVTHYQMGSG
jgi:hypothetical protein